MRLRIFRTKCGKKLERAEKKGQGCDQHMRQRLDRHVLNDGADFRVHIEPAVNERAVVAKRIKSHACGQNSHDCEAGPHQILPSHEFARYKLNGVQLSYGSIWTG